MDIAELNRLLLCALGIAYAVLMLWFAVFVFARDAVYRLHTRWFRLSPEAFDLANYVGMAVYKIATLLLFAVPRLALAPTRQ
jgi:hypothetical protein